MANGNEEQVWGHLPRFYGTTETSLGLANESELILNTRGEVAPTLEKLLRENGTHPELEVAITQFLDWLKHTGILTKNLLPHNLVVTDRRTWIAGRLLGR